MALSIPKEPVTLVIDFRRMKPGTIAEFNELFDTPPRLRGVPTGSGTRIISLVCEDMLPKPEGNNAGKPGNDFWRRINKPENQWDVPEPVANDGKNVLPEPVPENLDEAAESTVTLDFHREPDWRKVLYGSFGLNAEHREDYLPGQLYNLPADASVILKGAPWENPEFVNQLSGILETGKLEMNDREVSLDGVKVYRKAVAPEEVTAFCADNIALVQQPGNNFACINKERLFALLNTSSIQSGHPVYHDTLHEILMHAGGLRVTSSLSRQQWLNLIARLEAWRTRQEPPLPKIPVYVDDAEVHPHELAISCPKITRPSDHACVKCLQVDDEELAAELFHKQTRDALEVPVTPDMNFESLCGQMDIVALKKRQFSDYQASGFLQALGNGQPILIRGLNENPELQRQLESLLETPPNLVINGQRRTFPQAQIIVCFPEGRQLDSPVWENQKKTVIPDSVGAALRHITNDLNLTQDEVALLERVPGLLKDIQALPPGSRKEWPWPARKPGYALFAKIVRQARMEQKLYEPGIPLEELWLKAVNTVIGKEYKGNKEAHCWVRLISARHFSRQAGHSNNVKWLDSERLKSCLPHSARIDRTWVKEHIWELSRCLSPCYFADMELTFNPVPEPVTNLVCQALVTCCPVECNEGLRKDTGCTTTLEVKNIRYGHLERQIRDATIACGQKLPAWQLLREKSRQINSVLEISDGMVDQHQSLREILASLLPDQADCSDFADHLLNNQRNWKQWEQRRMHRLREMVDSHSLVFIKGEAGTGKSHAAEAIAHQLNPEQLPVIYTAGPFSDQESLLQKQALREEGEDQQSFTIEGPVLKWARTESSNGKPVILMVDEANLVDPGVWNCLKGLFSSQPFILVNGQKIPLSRHHRVIFTGNPETASGRKLDPFIRRCGVSLYYRPLDKDFLAEAVIKPQLASLQVPLSCQAPIMALWQHYKRQLTDHEFTPRDLKEVTSRIQFYLSMLQPGQEITTGGLSGLVWQAFYETLGCECLVEEKDRLDGLKLWFNARYDCDDSLLQSCQQAYEQFHFNLRRSSPHMNVDIASASALCSSLWQTLKRIDLDQQNRKAHPGKHATVIEGPAGRGKDLTLDSVIKQWRHEHPGVEEPLEPLRVNAGKSNWLLVRDKIKEAREQGRIIIISEMNLLPSEYLEGELNDILSGTAKPGFHLFATVNSSGFGGRQALSPAFRSRFVYHRIGDYNETERAGIARSLWTENSGQAEMIARWHRQVCSALAARNIKQGPTTGDLASVIKLCAHEEADVTASANHFSRQYRLYMKMAGLQDKDLFSSRLTEAVPAVAAVPDPVVRSLYESVPDLEPVYCVKGLTSGFDPQTRTLTLSDHLHEIGQMQEEAARIIAEHQWCQYGLPKSYPDQQDVLACAVYRWCQQMFAGQLFKDAEKGCQLFPLTRAEQDSLALSINQPWVKASQKVFQGMGQVPAKTMLEELEKVLSMPGQKLDIEPEVKALMAAPVEILSEQVDAADDRSAFRLHAPASSKTPLQRQVKGKGGTMEVATVFMRESDRSAGKERHALFVPQVAPDGAVSMESVEYGQLGYDIMYPEEFNPSVPVTTGQVCGTQTLQFSSGTAVPIAGLQTAPGSSLVSIRCKDGQPIHVFRDRFTGQYMVQLTECPRDWPVTVTVDFVISTKISGDSDNVCSDAHCPDSLKKVVGNSIGQITALSEFDEELPAASKIKIIRQFCSSFGGENNLESGSDLEVIAEILHQRPGTSYHRAMAFWALATCCQIPVRIACNNSGIYWCEYAVNDGQHWQPVKLGHYCPSGAEVTEKDVTRPDIATEKLPGLGYIQSKNCTTGELVRHMKLIYPGHPEFETFLGRLPCFISKVMAAEGATCLPAVKEYLDQWESCEPVNKPILLELVQQTREKVKKETINKSAFFELLCYLLVEKAWIKPEEVPDEIHLMSEDERYRIFAHKATTKYYKEVLSSPLRRGDDVLVSAEDLSDNRSNGYSMVTALAGTACSPSFLKDMQDERPSESFSATPPGLVNVGRLISEQDAFYKSAPRPARRPVIISVPKIKKHTIHKSLLKIAKNKEVPYSVNFTCYQEQKSMLLSDYLVPILERCFYEWLYQVSDCKNGNLKVLYPGSVLQSGLHERMCMQLDKSPEKPGWIIPESPAELTNFLSFSANFRCLPYNDQMLKMSWVADGMNQPDALLVTSAELEKYQQEFFSQFPFKKLVDEVKDSREFNDFLAAHIAEMEYKVDCSCLGGYESYGEIIDDLL